MVPQRGIILMIPPTPAAHLFLTHRWRVCIWGVFRVSGECLRIVWRVSGECLESVWKVSCECLEDIFRVSWGCLKSVSLVSSGCLVSDWKVFGECMHTIYQPKLFLVCKYLICMVRTGWVNTGLVCSCQDRIFLDLKLLWIQNILGDQEIFRP